MGVKNQSHKSKNIVENCRADNASFIDYLGYNADELINNGIPTDESVVTIRCAEVLVKENRGTVRKLAVPNQDSLFTKYMNAAKDLSDRISNDNIKVDSTPDELDIKAVGNQSVTYLEAKHANNKTKYNLREVLGQLSECPPDMSSGDMIAVGIPVTQLESFADAWTDKDNNIGVVTDSVIETLDEKNIELVIFGVSSQEYVKIDIKYLLEMYGKWSS